MSELVGVKCATCGEFIKIGEQIHSAAVAYTADIDPYPCKACGSSHTYATKDLVDECGAQLPYLPVYPQDSV